MSYNSGNAIPDTHIQRLESISETSAEANTFLGIRYYNEGQFEKSEGYFSKAAELNPDSEAVQLNLMRVRVAQGRQAEVYGAMGEFYHQTQSLLTPDQVQSELQRKRLDMPLFEVNKERLFELVK